MNDVRRVDCGLGGDPCPAFFSHEKGVPLMELDCSAGDEGEGWD